MIKLSCGHFTEELHYGICAICNRVPLNMIDGRIDAELDRDAFEALRSIMTAALQLIPPVLKGQGTYTSMGQILAIRDEITALADKFGEA